jgi:hypothetical protein
VKNEENARFAAPQNSLRSTKSSLRQRHTPAFSALFAVVKHATLLLFRKILRKINFPLVIRNRFGKIASIDSKERY